jgi:hypothetical protein
VQSEWSAASPETALSIRSSEVKQYSRSPTIAQALSVSRLSAKDTTA